MSSLHQTIAPRKTALVWLAFSLIKGTRTLDLCIASSCIYFLNIYKNRIYLSAVMPFCTRGCKKGITKGNTTGVRDKKSASSHGGRHAT